MAQRQWTKALVLAAVSGLIGGCGKSDAPSPAGAIPAPTHTPPVQVNLAGSLPVILGPENIQAEIDKAGAGVKLAKLDLRSAGLALTLDAPEGAKAQRGLSLERDAVDVEINAGDHFGLRIRRGKQPFEKKRQQLGGQKVLVSTNDLILASSMLLLDERCEFARHVVVGLQDYTIENVAPLLGRQVNHSQADCLVMLKCIATLAPCPPSPAAPSR
jgi:hypothetical protein